MSDPIVLRGFAAPYNVTVAIGNGVVERIQAGAFAEQCEYGLDCSVKLDSHDSSSPNIAHVYDNTLTLFESDHGLCFEAHIMPDVANFGSIAWEIHSRKYDKVSVHFSVRDCDIGDDGTEIVTNAQIDHLALCSNDAAYGGHTAVWNANAPFDTSNDRLVVMEQRWQEGYAAHLAARPDVAPATSSKRPLVASAEAVAAEQRFQMKLRAIGGHPHQLVRPAAAPVPTKNGKQPSITSMLAELSHRIVRRLVALEKKVDGQDSETMTSLLQSVDNIADRLIALEEKLAEMEQKQ